MSYQLNNNLVPVDIIIAFFEVAKMHPHQIAIKHNGQELSYAQLECIVLNVAGLLGPQCGNVGVIVTHSASSVVALLSILAAGGTYCPVGSEYPEIKQQLFAQEADCDTIIYTQKKQNTFVDCKIIDLTELSIFSNKPDHDIYSMVEHFNNPAYILFTSGSTGKPKPVVTPRVAISTVINELNKLFSVQRSDRVLQFASLNWDTSFEEIFPALTTGATLVIDDNAYQGSINRLLKVIDNAGITILNFPTAFWHELVYHLNQYQISLPLSVHTVVIGGESVQASRLFQWSNLETAHIRLINTYGSTETTLITHAIDLCGPFANTSIIQWSDNDVPIGNALDHVVEIINDNNELLIGGSSIATGYKGRDEDTEKSFCHIDVNNISERFFCTGDRVSKNEEGVLFHHGRLDNQLKIRGVRVEPGDVEAELLKYFDVLMAAVVGDTVADHTRLVAYVVPKSVENSQLLPKQIFSFLRENIPNHLIPSVIRTVTQFDFTASGKIDRAATHKNYLQFKL